ncbi:MAG: hypothetical protein U0X92_10220 [Anaerolineales bacterium]
MKQISIKAFTLLTIAVMVFSSVLVTPVSVQAAPGDTTRVSVDALGTQANDASKRSSISGDGRFIAFESDASNLIANDTNAATDIFVKDRQTGEVTRVSVDSSGAQANEGSGGAAISNDGRYVAFISDASNLVANDTNGVTDVFLRDRQLGTTTRISVSTSGESANAFSDYPLSISSDGRFVAFNSDASNLVPNDTNNSTDIFVHDNQTGSTERVSVASDGTQADSTSFAPSISANGQFVVFTSRAANLVSGDTNNALDVFVRDRQAGTTTRVSVNSTGVEANRGAVDGSISGDGRFVAFSSSSTNLMSEETSGLDYAYIHDRQTGVTALASVFSDGVLMTGRSYTPALSFDGRYIAFAFDDRGDSLPTVDIYVRDTQTGVTTQATRGGSGENDSSLGPRITPDGRFVTFWSFSSRLVSGDTNSVADAFVYETNFTTPDTTSPTVVSSSPLCATGCPFPTPSTVSFHVVFSEAVNGVTADDFALTTSGAVTGAFITDMSGSNNEYIVNVNTGSGDGTLRLDVVDNDSIVDTALNPLGGAGSSNGNFTAGGSYIVDKSSPAVLNILRADANPTSANQVRFTANFSEPVFNVDASDFAVATTGNIAGATLADVSGTGASYTVTVNTGTGDGTLRLNLFDNDSILDNFNIPLGGSGAGNGNFTSGEEYSLNRAAPVVTSILRADPNPSKGPQVRFAVAFSETVTGVDASDFSLAITGNISGAGIAGVTGTGNLYTVTVNTGAGQGNIRLDLLDNDSIVDAANLPLGGAGAGNANFSGEEYNLTAAQVTIVTASFTSNGVNDGWILESSENSNIGGRKNNNSDILRLGDDAQNRQYRAILHFPTYYLPDNAVVTEVILMVKGQGVIGTDPFTTHQNILVDIRSGVFGSFGPWGIEALQESDFQNPASLNSVGAITNNNTSGWYWTTLNSSAIPFINLTGVTQFRLGFQLDDNDDLGDDFITFYSGDYASIHDRPRLVIKYYIP